MLSRCNGTVDPHNYHDRGITLDPSWNRYERFLSDMGECPPDLTLERRDNDGPYCATNCMWADRAAQSRNTRRNVWVSLNGSDMVLKDAAKVLGVTDSAIHNIVKRRGLTHQQAIDRLIILRP